MMMMLERAAAAAAALVTMMWAAAVAEVEAVAVVEVGTKLMTGWLRCLCIDARLRI